ncbi:hypothetical protein [Corynebacterium bovis]|nr:hypothetical protein [Corynebacterium bovis]MBB3116396.1 hypothetical protein [Corynebacterium bovis DSM 20582 = CIP 54.80]MDH2455318.1 hypothetical protein [Corynebacterium bovis]MDK8510669.1 hypothetical protein [Corynebacterium bovis]
MTTERRERADHMSRLIAGGLVGLAVALAAVGSGLWFVHAVGAVIAVAGVLLARRPGGHPAWALVPWITFVIVFMVAWY